VVFEFCDWAEKRSAAGEAGVAQRVLREFGYRLFLLNGGRKPVPLVTPITAGFEILLAVPG
jgi:hypothetical protein